ncbi:MAG: RNA-binding protein [Candidatus Zixiibacteriota bacterium]
MNIYVGNMSYDTTEDQLRQAFKAFGEVSTVKIITDRDSGQPKGFAFVEMPEKTEGTAAIGGLNGKELNGRAMNVNEARPRAEGGSGGGGGRSGGGGGGNRSGGNNYRKMY